MLVYFSHGSGGNWYIIFYRNFPHFFCSFPQFSAIFPQCFAKKNWYQFWGVLIFLDIKFLWYQFFLVSIFFDLLRKIALLKIFAHKILHIGIKFYTFFFWFEQKLIIYFLGYQFFGASIFWYKFFWYQFFGFCFGKMLSRKNLYTKLMYIDINFSAIFPQFSAIFRNFSAIFPRASDINFPPPLCYHLFFKKDMCISQYLQQTSFTDTL